MDQQQFQHEILQQARAATEAGRRLGAETLAARQELSSLRAVEERSLHAIQELESNSTQALDLVRVMGLSIETGLRDVSQQLVALTSAISDMTELLANPRATASAEACREGYRALRNGDVASATVYFDRGLDHRPNDLLAAYGRATVALELDDLAVAAKLFATAARAGCYDRIGRVATTADALAATAAVAAMATLLAVRTYERMGAVEDAAKLTRDVAFALADCSEVLFETARLNGDFRYLAAALVFAPGLALHAAGTLGDGFAQRACARLLDIGVFSESGELCFEERQAVGFSTRVDALESAVESYAQRLPQSPDPAAGRDSEGSREAVARFADTLTRIGTAADRLHQLDLHLTAAEATLASRGDELQAVHSDQSQQLLAKPNDGKDAAFRLQALAGLVVAVIAFAGFYSYGTGPGSGVAAVVSVSFMIVVAVILGAIAAAVATPVAAAVAFVIKAVSRGALTRELAVVESARDQTAEQQRRVAGDRGALSAAREFRDSHVLPLLAQLTQPVRVAPRPPAGG